MKKILLILSLLLYIQLLFSQDVNKAFDYFDDKKYELAAVEFQIFIEKEREALDSSNYAFYLTYIGISYQYCNQTEKAKSYYLMAQSIYKMNPPGDNIMFIDVLNNLALIYQTEGRYNQAETLMLEAMRIDSTTYGENHPNNIAGLLNLAKLYLLMSRYEQGEILMKEVIQMDKAMLGENHPDYARDLNNLAQFYQATGRFEQAEQCIKNAMRIIKESLGENHPDYAKYLNNLAQLYRDMGLFEQAEPLMKEAIRITKESPEEYNPDYEPILNNLASLYLKMGQNKKAYNLLEEIIQIEKASHRENHLDHINTIHNLTAIYQEMGQFNQAEFWIKEAMQIDKALIGENSLFYCSDLSKLAMLYLDMGRYEQAEPLMKEAVQISKDLLSANDASFAIYLNNLASIYVAMDRYEQAEPLMTEVIRINKETLGENHPNYSTSLSNLACSYQSSNRYEQAEALMNEAIRIDKETIGEYHPSYGARLNNLAQLYKESGQYEKAEPVMKESMQITKESLGENHPSYSRDLNNLGQLYTGMGRYVEAELLIKEAMQITKAILGENHFTYAYNINNLVLLYVVMGRYVQVQSLMKEAYSILKNNLRNNSGYLTEIELSQFLEKFNYRLEIYQSYNYKQTLSNKYIGGFAMDIELYQKGLQLNSVIETRRRILNSGDTSLINNYQTMMAYRKQAETLYSLPKEQRFVDPVTLEAKTNDLEKDLKLRSKEYNRSLEEADITWKEVQDKMRLDEAVVEFASFPYYNKQWTDSTLYCALVLLKQDTMPHMVYLFEEKQLAGALPKAENSSDVAINNTYATLRGTQLVPDSSWYQSENLYNLVWKPLDSLLSGIKTVNYACSGLLNTISFAAIPDTTGKLLCEKYSLNQFSSTRNLAIETKELPITDATIYGGIQYELDTTLMIANSRLYSKTDNITLAYNSTRSGNNRGNGFDELNGTREEANAISKLFKEKKITTSNFTGAAANEESFKAMASKKSPSVIHLSTHGFYYPDTVTQRNRTNELQFIGADLNRFQYSPDPLLRSGIILAGANRVWRGEPVPDGVEDGILTAKDVSQLNLSNTQLVVLSACQTGLGDVRGSEGVFGLQRAFKMAGIRYLMMSLWSVPDKETKEFMEKFYSHWLSGIPIRQAFQNTQQEMRLEYPKEPYKWAAFVLVE